MGSYPPSTCRKRPQSPAPSVTTPRPHEVAPPTFIPDRKWPLDKPTQHLLSSDQALGWSFRGILRGPPSAPRVTCVCGALSTILRGRLI